MTKNQFCGYDVHPAANLFPMMTEEEFDALTADIKKHGQIIPVVLYRDMILDGRNRAMSCHKLGVTLKVVNKDEIEDPISWAISANAKRRNLTKSQLAMVAKDSLPLYEAEAKERQLATQNNEAGKAVKEKLPELDSGQARDKAAKATGVNPRYVSDAKRIAEESPEIADKVKSGEMTIQQAKRKLFETAAVHEPSEHEPEDDDSSPLFHLKRFWKAATKKDRSAFLKWVKTRK